MSRVSSWRTGVLAACLALAAHGCAGDERAQAPASGAEAGGRAPAADTGAEAGGGGTVYRIDMAQSEIYWRIYRAGAAARFGHNHVISVSRVDGTIVRPADGVESRFELEFPVGTFIVDDPVIRSRYGEDFATPPSADDIDGTRANMLGDGLLDAARYPSVHVRGIGPVGAPQSQRLELEIEIVGRTVPVTVPVSVAVDGERLQASGEFRLTHGDLGLTPFSVMMGALRVADEMDFTYRIVAVPVD